MKKIFIAFLLALLVISAVPVLGVKDLGKEVKMVVGSAVNIPERQAAALELEKRAEIKEKVKERVQVRKNELKETAEKLRACKGEQTEECKSLRVKSRKTAKNFLVNSVDKAISILVKARERISNSKLSEEEKQTALEEIDNKVIELNKAKTETQGKEEMNRNELKKAVGKIRSAWGQVRSTIAHRLHKSYLNKFAGVFKKTDKLQTKLERKLSKLSEKGVDVSSVDMSLFDSKLAEAKAAYEEAGKILEQAKELKGKEKKEILKQSKEQMKKAHRLLKDAREALKEILKQIRQASKGIKDTEEAEQETEEQETEEQETEQESEDEEQETEDEESEDLKDEETNQTSEE